jgi:DNA-binding transcriptional regulator YiaG
MSVRTKKPRTEVQCAFAFAGPVAHVDDARAALQALGFVETVSDLRAALMEADPRAAGHLGDGRQLVGLLLDLEDMDVETPTSVPWRDAFPSLSEHERPGRMLRAARTKEDLSQMQLAALTGIPQRHISEMEHGKRSIGKERAKKLADILQIDYHVFL